MKIFIVATIVFFCSCNQKDEIISSIIKSEIKHAEIINNIKAITIDTNVISYIDSTKQEWIIMAYETKGFIDAKEDLFTNLDSSEILLDNLIMQLNQ